MEDLDGAEPEAAETIGATAEDRRLLDLALLTIKLCLANVAVIALFAGVTIAFYPGMFATPRPEEAVTVLLVAGAVGILAILGFVLVGVANARQGVVLPWLLRGGKMP